MKPHVAPPLICSPLCGLRLAALAHPSAWHLRYPHGLLALTASLGLCSNVSFLLRLILATVFGTVSLLHPPALPSSLCRRGLGVLWEFESHDVGTGREPTLDPTPTQLFPRQQGVAVFAVGIL